MEEEELNRKKISSNAMSPSIMKPVVTRNPPKPAKRTRKVPGIFLVPIPKIPQDPWLLTISRLQWGVGPDFVARNRISARILAILKRMWKNFFVSVKITTILSPTKRINRKHLE